MSKTATPQKIIERGHKPGIPGVDHGWYVNMTDAETVMEYDDGLALGIYLQICSVAGELRKRRFRVPISVFTRQWERTRAEVIKKLRFLDKLQVIEFQDCDATGAYVILMSYRSPSIPMELPGGAR